MKKHNTTPLDLSNADWSKTNKQLAEEFDCHPNSISRRRPAGKKGKPGTNKEKFDFSKIDWGKSLKKLNDETGLSYNYLKNNRPNKFKENWNYDWDSVDWSMSNNEIAVALNCTPRAVAYRRRKQLV